MRKEIARKLEMARCMAAIREVDRLAAYRYGFAVRRRRAREEEKQKAALRREESDRKNASAADKADLAEKQRHLVGKSRSCSATILPRSFHGSDVKLTEEQRCVIRETLGTLCQGDGEKQREWERADILRKEATYSLGTLIGLRKGGTRRIPIASDSEVKTRGGMKDMSAAEYYEKKSNNPPAEVKRQIRFEYEEQMRGLEDQGFLYGGQGKIHGRLKDGFAIMRGEYVEDLHETDMYAVEEGW